MIKGILRLILGLTLIFILRQCSVDVDKAISSLEYSSFIDERNKQEYQVITLNNVKWMIENLNYKTKEGSLCYDNLNSNCDNLGRLYTYEAALEACPKGWRLPSSREWQLLTKSLNECEANYTRSHRMNSGKRKKNPPYNPQEGGAYYTADDPTISPAFRGKGSDGNFWVQSKGLEYRGFVNLLAERCGYELYHERLLPEDIDRGAQPNYYSCRCVQSVARDTTVANVDSL